MAILDRVKKRIETDLDDTELQFIIDEANLTVVNRFGPHSDPSAPITVSVEGNRHKIILERPVDVTQPIEIVEYTSEYGFGETSYTCQALDYRVWPNGLIIERLTTGTWSRYNWPARIEVTYVPINDGDQREEVIIKLVLLSIQYDALSVHTVGDVSANSVDYKTERESILASLNPRGGLMMA